jgi:hypothetical protein
MSSYINFKLLKDYITIIYSGTMASSSKDIKKSKPVIKTKKEEDICVICCNKYTKYLRHEIECLYCNHKVCMNCVKQYLTTSINDPDCMSCHKLWNRDFLDKNLTRSYCDNELKQHRQKILMDREKALLPLTQAAVKRELEIRSRREEYQKLILERSKLKNQLRDINNRIYRFNLNPVIVEKEKVNNFIRACPAPDCRGFLESKWTCGICKVKVCAKCHEIKDDNEDESNDTEVKKHECNPDSVATAELINKDSKPCPACASIIQKISGCNMMFCVQCLTGFDWATGTIYKNRNTFHNPEYTAWLAKQNNGITPRAAGDELCGGLPHVHILQGTIRHLIIPDLMMKFLNIHRFVNHVQYYELPRHPANNFIRDNEELRIKYLLNELTDNELKSRLESKEKAADKANDIRNIYDMFVNVASEQLRDILINPSYEKCLTIEKIMNELKIYTNNSFKNIAKRYKSVAPIITDTWYADTSYYKE